MNRFTSFALLSAAVWVLFAGCAQDVGTVDRVQDNYVKKSDLLFNENGTRKEWYFRLTVTETPYASAYTFPGNQDPIQRGVFEIQEDYLYFYRTYSFVAGEDSDNPRLDTQTKLMNADGTPYLIDGNEVWRDKNSPLMAYPITKHFDIIWDYNPVTGEPGNVKVENSSDRMWYDREFVRADWGANMLPTYLNKFQAENAYQTILLDASVAPELEANLTPSTGYMEFQNMIIAGVQTDYLDGYGDIPICWYYPWYAGGLYECVSEKIKLRSSFMVVDIAREDEYTPIQYSDYDQERFGFFRAERLRWDKDYGTVYSLFQRYATRFDIWKKDADGKIIGVRPIVYHVSVGYPNNMVSEAALMAAEWSKAFDATVRSVTGKEINELPAYSQNGGQILDADGNAVFVDHMFIVCENNQTDVDGRDDVEGTLLTDEAICGSLENPKVNGDMRYSFLYSVNEPMQYGLYGYGPPAWDPLSGRIITGTAYVYNAAFHTSAVRAIDMIELLSGVKSFREIADATYIEQMMKNDRLQQFSYWRNGYTNEEAKAVVDKLVTPEVSDALTGNAVIKADQSPVAGRMNIINNSPELEQLFVNADVRWLFKDPTLVNEKGQAQSANFSDENKTDSNLMEKYSLSKWAHAGGTKKIIEDLQKTTAAGIDRAEYYDGAIMGLANDYKKKYDAAVCADLKGQAGLVYKFSDFNDSHPCNVADLIEQLRAALVVANNGSPFGYKTISNPTPLELSCYDPTVKASQKAMIDILDSIRPQYIDEIQQLIFYGVAIHELGHSVGLRHNFEASTDAMNFPREYWDLKVKKNGDNFDALGLFKETPEQVAASMRMYQYSSVMDYYMKFNMPWLGLGLYDIAAIKYAYGNLVEVYKDKPDTADYDKYINVDPTKGLPDNTPSFKDRGEGFGLALRRIHHTEYPNMFGDVDKMYDRVDVDKADIYGQKCESEGASCGEGKVCKKVFEGLLCSLDKTVVPYRFGSDEMAFYLPTVAMWDEGVDAYEIARNTAENYENQWVFRGYWHQDPTFWPSYYDNAIRYDFIIMKNQFQWWAVNFKVFNNADYWQTTFGQSWDKDINGGLPGSLATSLSFNVFAGTFGRPIPEAYGYNWKKDRFEPRDDVNTDAYRNQIYLLEEDGARPIYSNWDYNYYDPVVTSAGTIYDRLAAFEMLTDPRNYFIGTDKQADVKKYYVNYGSVFRDGVNNLLGGLLANNADNYGWCILLHPVSDQPIGFGPRDFVGSDYASAGCLEQYKGCFTKSGSAPDKLRSIHRADESVTNPCATGEMLADVEGKALEPEPQYTFPTTQFRIPMLAAYYGFSMLTSNFDRSFMDMTRVWLQGDAFDITMPVGAIIATCEDRFTGKIYTAYKLNDGKYYPGYDLVKQCDEIYRCYDEVLNDSLTPDETKKCEIIAKTSKAISELTIDDLRGTYLWHPLQFLVGKLELIRTMYVDYEFNY
jgi:hypothetical protein